MDKDLTTITQKLSRTDEQRRKYLQTLSTNGIKTLIQIIETLQQHEQGLAVVGEANKAIRRAVRQSRTRVPQDLLNISEGRQEVKANVDIIVLLKECEKDPPKIFENMVSGSVISAARDLPTLHRYGRQILDKVDRFRRALFCVIISDANEIINPSPYSRKPGGCRTDGAMQRLAVWFLDSGVQAPEAQVKDELRDWVNRGGRHRQDMDLFSTDGHLAIESLDMM